MTNKYSIQFKVYFENLIYYELANRGPFNAFFVRQSFFSSDLFWFWRLGYPGVRRLGWRGHTCVENLPWVGSCTKFGGDWSGSWRVKEEHRYIHTKVQTVCFIYIDSYGKMTFSYFPKLNLKPNFPFIFNYTTTLH